MCSVTTSPRADIYIVGGYSSGVKAFDLTGIRSDCALSGGEHAENRDVFQEHPVNGIMLAR